MTNLASLLERSAEQFPDRAAVVLGGVRLTYAEVNGAANQVANVLAARGIGAGDKVALSCPNLPYFPIVYYGILKAGATVVPLNVLLKGREVAYHLDDSDAKAYFCFEGTPELAIGQAGKEGYDATDSCEHFFVITADPAAASPIEGAETLGAAMGGQAPTFDTVEVDDDDTAVILYTSGTTGQPKGAELMHSNMLSNAQVCQQLFDTDPARQETLLCVLPLFHSFGQTVIMNGGFAIGWTVVLQPRFEPVAALQLMAAEEVTIFEGVPTMYWGLLGSLEDSGVDAAAARRAPARRDGGRRRALPVEVHASSSAPRRDILEGYGSETSPVTASEAGEPARAGSIGVPIPDVEMKLINPDPTVREDLPETDDTVGEIAIKGPNIMKGYWQRPDATEAAIVDGWFRSGDLARKDEDGWYYIVDRSKDMIIRGGYNVYPREVEEVLISHPDVSLAAVIGVPHESHGEEVKAFVILNDGATATPDDLVAWSKEQMASYKYPREVEVVSELPMTATGKILKRELH